MGVAKIPWLTCMYAGRSVQLPATIFRIIILKVLTTPSRASKGPFLGLIRAVGWVTIWGAHSSDKEPVYDRANQIAPFPLPN
jgi:hypothetical protein